MEKIKVKKKQALTMKGVYTFTKAKLETPEQWALNNEIGRFMHLGYDVKNLINKLNSICKTEITVVENIIPTVARTMIANNLVSGNPTDIMRINYTALGTSQAAVDNSDTTLGTETYRKTTASYTNSNNIAYITAFYTATEINGTLHEAGLFSNASAATDSGVLFSRVLLNQPTGIVKSVTETLTVDYTITIS